MTDEYAVLFGDKFQLGDVASLPEFKDEILFVAVGDFRCLEAAKYTWIFQPQAQAIWMGVDHNAHTEANGSRIENDANNNIQTRLGFRTFIRTQEKNSGPHGDDFEPFVEMNWIHNSKDFAVSMNGVKVEQDGASNLGEIKLGVNGNLNPAASVWGMWACSWVIMATMTPQ